MYYITGDRHGQLVSGEGDLLAFSRKMKTAPEDVLILLGDAGLNYHVQWNRKKKKYESAGALHLLKMVSRIPLTFLVVQGNHEAPAWYCEYMERSWSQRFQGPVWSCPEAANILFLENGEIYTIDSREYLVMGGADSIDKAYRQIPDENGTTFRWWFPQEQMTDAQFRRARACLKERNGKVHGILAHTCPFSRMPRDLFLPSRDPLLRPDSRQEEIFEKLKDEIDFEVWYFGHFHGDRVLENGKYRMLFQKIEELL